MMKLFNAFETPTKTPVQASFGYNTLIVGQTGSGKSIFLRNLILQGANTCGSEVQFICLDPKRVSFLGLDTRCHIFTDSMDFLKVLTSIENEMLRRYEYMAENSLATFPVSEDYPQIVLVVDELPAFMMAVGTTKERKNRSIELLTSIANQCRQCGITVVLSGQTVGSDVMPTAIRSSFAQRFLLKIQTVEQLKIACDGRIEEAEQVSVFYLPGQVAACSPHTRNEYVYGRVLMSDVAKRERDLDRIGRDKRALACLDWTGADFRG